LIYYEIIKGKSYRKKKPSQIFFFLKNQVYASSEINHIRRQTYVFKVLKIFFEIISLAAPQKTIFGWPEKTVFLKHWHPYLLSVHILSSGLFSFEMITLLYNSKEIKKFEVKIYKYVFVDYLWEN
jgi:hypothetical protein